MQLPEDQRAVLLGRLASAGMATQTSDGFVELTALGRESYQKLLRRREEDLRDMLADWDQQRASGREDDDARVGEIVRSHAPSQSVSAVSHRAADSEHLMELNGRARVCLPARF